MTVQASYGSPPAGSGNLHAMTGGLRMLRCLLVVMLMQIPGLAFADTAAALSSCVADNTSGKQRKDLARWVFFAMAAHPDLASYTTPELGAAREETDRTTADLFVHLITEQCPGEASAAFAERQTAGIQVAFEELGRLAMLELMSHSDTTAAMSNFEKYLDNDKIAAVLHGK